MVVNPGFTRTALLLGCGVDCPDSKALQGRLALTLYEYSLARGTQCGEWQSLTCLTGIADVPETQYAASSPVGDPHCVPFVVDVGGVGVLEISVCYPVVESRPAVW